MRAQDGTSDGVPVGKDGCDVTDTGGGGASSSGKDDDSSETSWRNLIPVIKADISMGKVVFGNKFLPRTLVISFEEAHCTYSTKPAACNLDNYMHFVKCKAENFKILLSPRYGPTTLFSFSE